MGRPEECEKTPWVVLYYLGGPSVHGCSDIHVNLTRMNEGEVTEQESEQAMIV